MATSEPPPEEKSTVPVTLHLTPAQIEWLSDQADQQDVPVACVARRLLDSARGSGVPDPVESHSPVDSASSSAEEETTLDRLREAKDKLDDLRSTSEGKANDQRSDDEVPSRPFWPEIQSVEQSPGDLESSNPDAPSDSSFQDSSSGKNSGDDPSPTASDSSDGSEDPPSMFDLAKQNPEMERSE